MNQIVINTEFKNLIPPLTPEEYAGLEESIKKEGCRDSLVVWNNTLIDGHNRYEICNKHSIEYTTVELPFSTMNEAMIWIIDNAVNKRNLNAYQRTSLQLKRKELLAPVAKEKKIEAGKKYGERHPKPKKELQREKEFSEEVEHNYAQALDADIEEITEERAPQTRDILAKAAGVSHETVRRVEIIEEKAPEETKKKLVAGDISINEAYKNIQREERKKLPPPIPPTLPVDKFHVLLVDPPWQYDFSKSDSRSIESKYPTMTLDEIKELEVPAADNSVLYLWATVAKLREALAVMDAWGYEYKSHAIWDKELIGMGYWFRGSHELLLVGVKGTFSPPPEDKRVSSVIRAKRGQHSKKPIIVYEIIEASYPNHKKVELFARNTREGWISWGSEVT